MKKENRILVYSLIVMGLALILTNSCKKDKNNDQTPTIQVPVLTTSPVTNITNTTATCGGNITSDGGATITARGVCWDLTTNPTVADNKTMDSTGTGTFTSSITGLIVGYVYYVRAYATNSVGVSYGNELSFYKAPGIGYSFQGGKVAYILQAGDPGYDVNVPHGIIAAPTDQSTSIQWYNGTYILTGATATAIGTGYDNTNNIVVSQGSGNYAAKLCADFSLNGYSDWHLPSKDELNKLYLNKVAVGGFAGNVYWSSSESDNLYAWSQYFDDGLQLANDKGGATYVRAVRTF